MIAVQPWTSQLALVMNPCFERALKLHCRQCIATLSAVCAAVESVAHLAVLTLVTILSSGSVFLLTSRATSWASDSATRNTLIASGINCRTVAAPCTRTQRGTAQLQTQRQNATCRCAAECGAARHSTQHTRLGRSCVQSVIAASSIC